MRYDRRFVLITLLAAGLFSGLAAAVELEECSDGIDNDWDGKTDCQDEDCAGLPGGCVPKYQANLRLINNCQSGDLYVTVNAHSDWQENGNTICPAGHTCPIPNGGPGYHRTFGYDASHGGLDFHIGSAPDEATKAEVSYVLKRPNNGQPELSYDISLIAMSGCPNSCKDSSCCEQHFNEALKIYEPSVCRCLYCDNEDCPDAFHYPTDNRVQANCPQSTSLTIEFCPAKDCSNEHGGVRTCTKSERQTCSTCTGDLVYCCPESSYGSDHECLCQKKSQWCAAFPDPGSGCGTDIKKYCYVSNTVADMDPMDTGFQFMVDNQIDDTSSICPLYGGSSVSIWHNGSKQGIDLAYGMNGPYTGDLSTNGGLGIQVNYWYWDREPHLPIQKTPPQNPDNSGDNFIISTDCKIERVEPAWYGKGQRTSRIAEVTARHAHRRGNLCIITIAPNEYTQCVTKSCCAPPGYANTCQESDAYVSECSIP